MKGGKKRKWACRTF